MSQPSRALVVDDEPTVYRLVALALTRAGFTCDIAADGQEAAERIARNGYDVIVTDLRMPKKDGYKLVGELLEYDDRPVIVMYTGAMEQNMARELLARGADHIAFKPTNLALLATRIRSLVDRRCEQRAAAAAG